MRKRPPAKAGSGVWTFNRVLIAQVAAQTILLVVLSVMAPTEIRSALIGAAISMVGNGYAVRRVFARSGKRSAQWELATLYRAEFGKLFIVGMLCVVTFFALDGIRIAGFIAGLLVGLIAATIAAATQKIELPND